MTNLISLGRASKVTMLKYINTVHPDGFKTPDFDICSDQPENPNDPPVSVCTVEG